MLKTQKEKKIVNCFSTNNKTNNKKNIIVGLSGGVDSSLTAALLVESGWNVEGLTLWLMKGQGSCCSEGLVDAAGLCEDLGINHKIIDSRGIFEREVIKKTTESYEKGFTPLPCSMCNKNVKFEEMLNYAINKKRFTHIATGHYARIKKSSNTEILDCEGFIFKDFLLLRGADKNKDQSYFLYCLTQEVLSTVWVKSNLYDSTKSALSTWIFTIARNKKIDFFRKNSKINFQEEDIREFLYQDREVDPIEENEAKKQIERINNELDEQQKIMIKMNFFENKSHKKIADELEIPLGTVKSRIRHILTKMQEFLR